MLWSAERNSARRENAAQPEHTPPERPPPDRRVAEHLAEVDPASSGPFEHFLHRPAPGAPSHERSILAAWRIGRARNVRRERIERPPQRKRDLDQLGFERPAVRGAPR